MVRNGLDYLGATVEGVDNLKKVGRTVRIGNGIGGGAGLLVGATAWKTHRIWGGILGSVGGGIVGAVVGLVVGAKLYGKKSSAAAASLREIPAFSRLTAAEQKSLDAFASKGQMTADADKQIADMKKLPADQQLAMLKQAAAVAMAMDGTGKAIEFSTKI
jgi:hypothetical protein